MLAVFQRAKERKASVERQEIDIYPQKLEKEFEKQRHLLDHEATRMIAHRLKAGNLPLKVRQLMREVQFSQKLQP